MAKRIYRAQSRGHEYFIPTALRCQNIWWLKNNPELTCQSEVLVLNCVDNSNVNEDPEYRLCDDSIKMYYLSLRHIISEVHSSIQRGECIQDCEEFSFADMDWYSVFKDHKMDTLCSLKESVDELNQHFSDLCLKLRSFGDLRVYSNARLPFLKLSAYFQHCNFRKKVCKSLTCGKKRDYYPTMCLDFSNSIDTLNRWNFINPGSVVYSIDVDKIPKGLYYSYNHKYDYKIHLEDFDTPINENNNALMKEQEGYCIYWPWRYTVEELQENEMFGFRVEVGKGN